MAWIYSVESGAFLSDLPNGYEQSHIVNKIDTAKVSLCLECLKACCIQPQYGMTCEHCHQSSLEYPLTSSSEDFLVRTSVLQEMESVWKASEVLFTLKSSDYVVNYDPDSFSWKTSQLSLFGGLTEFCWSSLRWGMIRDGRLYQPQSLEPHTSENDGSYLPTPTATEYGVNQSASTNAKARPSLSTMARKNLWPTPTVCGNYNRKGASKTSGDGLATVAGGPLNPKWVEWLMGYPLGWTELKDWAIQWFRCKQEKHLND